MREKTKAILIITVIYIIMFVIGYLSYAFIPLPSILLSVLVADVIMTIFIWLLSLILKNASLYDPYWSVVPPVIILFLMIDQANFGMNLILLLIGVLIWSIRLTYNWAKLFKGLHEQDWRYDQIKAFNPKLFPLTNLTGIMMFPTLIVFAQLIGLTAMIEVDHQLGISTIIGFILIVLATLLQFISDSQMQIFKKTNQVKNKIIDIGLWKYSRHPNYLGEILIWFGVYMFYADVYGITPHIFAPIGMLLMFLVISIPMMERKILKTRPAYKMYQKEVAMLIPFVKFKLGKEQHAQNETSNQS